MPAKHSPPPLKMHCISAISENFELISYGCTRGSFLELLESGDYKKMPGPYTDLPSTLLEDLITSITSRRGLPTKVVHQLIQPQLETFQISQRISKHIVITLLTERCAKLKALGFSYSKGIHPEFYTKFFTKFPMLMKLDLEGTIIDDSAFDSVGNICENLREIHLADSTISDLGLRYLCWGSNDELRCQKLVSIDVLRTRVTAKGVASLLHFHSNLLKLEYENFSKVFEFLHETIDHIYYKPVYSLRKLRFTHGRVLTRGFTWGLQTCPFLDWLIIKHTDLSHDLLYSVMEVKNMTKLHLGNSNFTQDTLTWDEGIAPVLSACGPKLLSLTLEKFNSVDVSIIGEFCPNIKILRLSSIREFTPSFNPNKAFFSKLVELELLNTRGAHVYSNNLRQLLFGAQHARCLTFQFIDTLNDEVWMEILTENQMRELEKVTFDQCHSISNSTLEELLERENNLQKLSCWSCRFITDTDKETINNNIKLNHFNMRFEWFAYAGEQVPLPLDDLEEIENNQEEEDDEEEFEPAEFFHYWNHAPQL